MAGNGVRRGVIALVLLVAVVGAGVVLAGGALLQDEGDAGGAPDDATVAQENRTVDADRVNVTVQLEPTDETEDELRYELVVVGEIAAANDAADGTVDCDGELCVVTGNVTADAGDEDLPQYELRGVVTSASPEDGYTANVTGTLDGDAIEGLGLGAYNVTAPNTTDAANDSAVPRAAMEDDGTASSGVESLQTDGGTTESDESSEPDDSDAETTEDAGETDEDAGETTEDAGETTEDSAETPEDSAETPEDAGETTEDAGETPEDSAETPENDDETTENDDETTEAGESGDESDGESPSVTFDGCSSATVEGDAYAYEAGLRYYVQSGLDTSTIDQSEVSTPTTIDGNDLISDARTTDVVVETVLVLDEDFGVVTQASNPNYEDCADEIEQQHADWEDEQGDEDANATA